MNGGMKKSIKNKNKFIRNYCNYEKDPVKTIKNKFDLIKLKKNHLVYWFVWSRKNNTSK